MLESKNMLLDTGKVSTSAAKSASAASEQRSTEEAVGQFSALLGDATASLKVAKSGNMMPLSELLKSQGSEMNSAAMLSSRTLKGGTALMIGGAEPSDAGLIAFARAQGMDPASLGLLTSAANLEAKDNLPKQGAIANPAIPVSPHLTGGAPNSRLVSTDASYIPAPKLQAHQLVPLENKLEYKASSVALPSGDLVTGSTKPLAQVPVAVEQLATDQQRLQQPQDRQSGLNVVLPQQLQVLKGAVELAISIPPMTLENAKAMIPELDQPASLGASKVSLAALSSGVNILDIKAKNSIPSDKLSASSAAVESAPGPRQIEASKISLGAKVSEVFLEQYQDRQKMPVIKMDPISLVDNKLLTVTNAGAVAVGPLVSASTASAPLFVDGQVANPAAQASLSSDLSIDAPAEDTKQETLRRQDDYMQLSRQLTEVLGKRLTAQIQRGSWHVEMDLHPKSLGRVEVQLEMKNGELEARFMATNATTRDLINEGMPRLREALLEHGTETAYKNLGEGNRGASDGKSTASEQAAEESNGGLSSEVETGSPKTGQGVTTDGLNVLV
jgi:hypothetical protein